ncbi:MAG: phosphoglycerate mutase family protein, partial [Alphaproteobacteria bacterium]
MTETRFWWVRHAPVVDNGGLVYGGTEVDADVKEARLFRGLSMTLPTNAVFVASALARTRQTLQAVRSAGRADIPAEPEQDPRLNEQHLGDWHGRPIA